MSSAATNRIDYPLDAASLRDEISDLLQTVRDHGTVSDTGGGMGQADLWVTVQGVEYFVTVRKSNNQLAKEKA